MAINKRGLGFDLKTTKNKSSKWPEQGLNQGPPDCKSNTLTTQSCCLLKVFFLEHETQANAIYFLEFS